YIESVSFLDDFRIEDGRVQLARQGSVNVSLICFERQIGLHRSKTKIDRRNSKIVRLLSEFGIYIGNISFLGDLRIEGGVIYFLTKFSIESRRIHLLGNFGVEGRGIDFLPDF